VNIHTRFVGALNAIILSLTAAMTVVMVLALLVPSFASLERADKRGTVTIQQLAMEDTASVRHM
jgi:hypothetical protein